MGPLRRMGIVLGENATEADALAAVQAKFGGQASEFAKSTAGQFEQAKLQMGELQESIGAALLPVMTVLAGVLAQTIVPAMQKFADEVVPKITTVVEGAVGALGAVVETPVGSDRAGAINDRCGTQHPEAWRAAVRDRRADGGLAFDGDADRCFFVDDQGEFVPGDFITAVLADLTLRREPGATILYDVRASRAVADTIEAALRNRSGGMTRTEIHRHLSGHVSKRDLDVALEMLESQARISRTDEPTGGRPRTIYRRKVTTSTSDDADGRPVLQEVSNDAR